MKTESQRGRRMRSSGPAMPRSDQRGTSLIEIVVATLILSIIAIGMVEFFARGHAGFDQEERKRVGTLLAQEALERTVALSYDQIDDWTEDRTIGTVDYTITVTAVDDAPESDMKTVACTVTWNSAARATRQAALTTFVYNN